MSRKPDTNRLRYARSLARHTDEQWQDMLLWAGWRCVKCDGPFTASNPPEKDHVLPVAYGGSDAIYNVQPLCGPCNRQKGSDAKDYRDPTWQLVVLNTAADPSSGEMNDPPPAPEGRQQ